MQALSGIRVLDLTQIYQGPYAAFLMAMAGAEVVKVEPHDGDRIRRQGEKTPMAFAMLNSNKKSVTIDLKTPRGKEILKDMARKADVLLENFAPGTMDRLGLGWSVMREINPRLIYASATGYGLSGPDRDQLAMDHTIQAACGLMSITGEAGGPPARAGGTPIDIMGGIHMYAGVLQALFGRHATGKGTLVETAMIEAMYFTLSSEFTAYHNTGKLSPRRGDKTPSITTPYGRYRCSDGWIAMMCVAETHWDRVLQVIGREDLRGDPDYEGNFKRHDREAEINEMIEAWTKVHSRDEAFGKMRDAKIPVAPIRNIADVRNDPHMHARGMLVNRTHPELGEIVLPTSPIRLSEYDSSDLEFFPEIGQDNSSVFADWLGMEESEIAALSEEGVI
ncbi:MAG: CoA transferase [Alphaproteobacteria bacterium]